MLLQATRKFIVSFKTITISNYNMNKELDRNWNKGRVNIWERGRPPPSNLSQPPLLPPPPARSRPTTTQQQPTHPISCDEALRRLWQRGSSPMDSRERMCDRNPGRTDEGLLTERNPRVPPANRNVDDTVRYGRPAWQQVLITAPVQVKRKSDKKKSSEKKGKDDGQDRLPPPPPPPPRLDFPVDGRANKLEYRRVDEYDEDPRLRAELYPLEDEPPRKGGSYRHAPETIDILPERIVLQPEASEMNVVHPKKGKDYRMDDHDERTLSKGRTEYLERRDQYRTNRGSNDNMEEMRSEHHEPKSNQSRREVPSGVDESSNESLPERREDVRRRRIIDEEEERVEDYRHRRVSGDDDVEKALERRSITDRQQSMKRSSLKEDVTGRKRDSVDSPRRATFEMTPPAAWKKSSPMLKKQQPSTPEFPRKRSGGEVKKQGSVVKKWSPQYHMLKDEEDDISLEKRDSVLLPSLEDNEKEFHDLVASGDVSAVKLFLWDHSSFNINCVNYQQISALHVAVHEQNEAMVEFLLAQPNMDCADCALYAIKEGNLRIAERILDKLRETSPDLEYAPATHSVDFPDFMTPIILAAQLGNYEIIDFLIKRDHVIPPVHNPYCKCAACKEELQKYDRLKYSTMKLNLYKAISNPMYIFHVTDDPFQRAFDLTQELMDAAKVFPQFKNSYEELWRELRNFTVELIGCCRNAQEVEIILKKSANNLAGSITFPRLQYAIDLKQKEFVSHPYTQAVLVDAWTGDLLEWKVRSPIMQALSVFPRIPMLPVIAVMCMFLPNHKLVTKWKTPVNKMISSVASYLIFLIILFLESNLDKTNQKRGPPNSGLEGIIVIYVIGYIWLNIRICFRLGPKRFFSTMWHWFDCIMLFLFTMTIIFWVASLADITANDEIDLPRKYWNALDPELIAEGFFAAAVIMAFFRLNMFLSLNYHLGPLQVSIGKMTLDIFQFIIVFSIMILAWCAGLCRFYQPYDGMVQKDAASGSSTSQVSSFVSFAMTLKTLFWAIFGMSPIESADVIIENLPGDTGEATVVNHHDFTEAVGYIAFALFQFLSVVVVLNMLVACMANTFTKVIDNVTVEWVFGRSQIYLSFMASSTLPPPFNLLPTASGIKNMFLWLKLLGKSSDGQRAKCNITHCCYIESETEAYVNNEFPALMTELAQRYLRLKGESGETQDELEELKSEMREVLRKVDEIITMRK